MKKVIILLLLLTLICGIGYYIYTTFDSDTFEYTVNDTLPDGGGKKAKVILLGGQSNASGCSRDDYLQRYVTEEEYEQYKNGFENVYINYLSGAKMSGEFVKCATLQGEMDGCFGPELGIADKLNELYPDETFFIIKCAWGGSNLFKQWLSPSSFGKTGELYSKFVGFVESSLRYLESKNYDVEIEAMCWMQGESDAVYILDAEAYEKNLFNLIKDIRKRFEQYASSDGIAFVDAYIADNSTYWVHYDIINEAKQTVADLSPINTVIDTVSHGLTCSEEPEGAPDLAHYDSMSGLTLGHLFAEEAIKFFD